MSRHAYFEQFEDQVILNPARTALKTELQNFTYCQLNRWSNAIALRLTEAQSQNIGILIDSEAAYIAAMLACGKAGKCFVPLDIRLPETRLNYLLEKAQINTVVCIEKTASYPEKLPDITTIYADYDETVCGRTVYDHNPGHPIKGTEACYIMFTSGSTGLPKAVVGQHKGLAHFLNWERETFAFGEQDICAWLAPVTFDVSLRDILLPLTSGGMLAIPTENTRRQVHQLLAWFEQAGVTHVHCVPSVFRLLTEALDQSRIQAGQHCKLPALKRVLLAGEPLYYEDVSAWRAAGGAHISLVNLYGPTETTLAKVFHVIDHNESGEGMVAIGQPLPQTNVLIINGRQLCAPGDIGEIYIRTPYRSLGYLEDAVATSAVFVQNPLHDEQRDILYKTGDLGRYLDNNDIVCLGRLDNQVKINGIRVETGEAEAACRQIAGLHQVAVKAIEKNREKSLCCYYNCKEYLAEPLSANDIRQALSAQIGEALIPTHYVYLPKFPTLINGKINRKALPEPEAILYASQDVVAPQTPVEETLCQIWSEVLGLRNVCVATEFFALGGDSFKMMRVLSAIYKQFGQEISIKQWLADSRIQTIAKLLSEPVLQGYITIPEAPQQAAYPVTAAQERLWTLHKMYPGIHVYNLPEEYLIEGYIDIPALNQACQRLIERHESLRTVFFEQSGKVWQRILPQPHFTVEHQVYDVLDDDLTEQLIRDNQHLSFDLQQGPLIRVCICACRKSGKQILLFNIHHIICDGWSLTNFVKELTTEYQACRHQHPATQPPLRIQFKDYVLWQQAQIQSESGQQSRAWWLTHLASSPLPILELPRDYPRPAMRTFDGKTERVVLPPLACDGLNRLTKQLKVSLFTLLMFTVRTLLYRYSGQRDVIIGSPVAGRFHPELNRQIGYYVNTLALRQTLDPEVSVANAIQETAACIHDALAHQHYPFEALIEALDLSGDISRSSVFDVMLVMQNFEFAAPQLGDTQWIPIEKSSQWDISRCDLLFHVQEDEQGLLLDINYNSDIFAATRIQRYGNHFLELIAGMINHTAQPVSNLSILPGDELRQIKQWGTGPSVARPSHSIPSLFTEVCRRFPSATALSDNGKEIGYQQLLTVVQSQARGLQACGYHPGDVVAVAYDRHAFSIIAMLATLMAGCIYMPLDMTLPSERIHDQLADSGCRGVICAEETFCTSIPADIRCFSAKELNEYGQSDDVTLPGVHPQAPAYIIYTSGSTGTPKGVLLGHRGFINMSLAQIEAFNMTPESRVLQFASLSFDASLANIFMALFSGARLVLIDQQSIEQPQRFLNYIRKHQITTVTLPPAYLRALNQPDFSGLQTLVTAGEAADAGDMLHYCQTLNVFNAYGPTEISVCATIEAITAKRINQESVVSIGKPIANTELWIVVDDQCIAPIGVPGEIWIAGEGLAKSYMNDHATTQQAFVRVPMPLQAYTHRKTMYKTGDLAYWDREGRLIYIGRNDNQVKINAFRVDTSEIEGHLLSHHDISAACVTGYQSGDTNKLAAWVIPERQPELWPSVAEFYIYDDVLYGAMASDEARNAVYLSAFRRYLKDQTVLEIGPGSEAILSRLAIEAGAKKVYAIELLEETYRKAKETVRTLALEDKIEIIHADIRQAELPESADWCISEIIGGIGGSEGAAILINSCRRLLKDPSHMLPMRTLTSLAAVSLDHESLYQGFSSIAAHYIQQIFETHGQPFDLRLCVKNLPKQAVISDYGVLEDLDYTQPVAVESTHTTHLTITQPARLSGLVCWLELYVDQDNYLDSLFADKSWLPVYIPLFDGRYEPVGCGDQLILQIDRHLCDNQLNPDFLITGYLCRKDGVQIPIRCDSLHQSRRFRDNAFYRRVFSTSPAPQIPVKAGLKAEAIREYLADRLPHYAVPHFIQLVDAFPLTVNGKIDRSQLPAPEHPASERIPLSTEMEKNIAAVWQQVLSVSEVGATDNFFASGGDSISAIRVVADLSDLHISIDTRDIFLNPTVAQLALVAGKNQHEAIGQGIVTGTFPLHPIQRWALTSFSEQTFWFNQGCMLHSPTRFDDRMISQAFIRLLEHHDVLRAQIHQQQDGEFIFHITDEVDFRFDCEERMNTDSVEDIGQEQFNHWQSGFTSDAPLFRVILIRLQQHDTLLLLANHLIIDTVSWRIIWEDLKALLRDPQYQLPPKTESYGKWNLHLQKISHEVAIQHHLHHEHWERLARQRPVAPDQATHRTVKTSREQTFCIENQFIEHLMQLQIETPYQPEHIYLAALSHALHQLTGTETHIITMESHGRNTLPADKSRMNISRTVGWFTCFYPLQLRTQSEDAATLQQVVTEAEKMTEPGLSYMLSRWANDNEIYQYTPFVSFNYLGDFSGPLSAESSSLELDLNVPGFAQHPEMKCDHALDCLILREAKGLMLTITCDQQQYNVIQIEQLAADFKQSLQNLAAYLTQYHDEHTETGAFDIDITNAELNSIFD